MCIICTKSRLDVQHAYYIPSIIAEIGKGSLWLITHIAYRWCVLILLCSVKGHQSLVHYATIIFLQIPESILRTVVTMMMIIPQPVDHKRFSKFVSKIIINFYVNIVL